MLAAALRTIAIRAILLWLAGAPVTASQIPEREALRERVGRLSPETQTVIDGAPIAATTLIPALYQRREFEPAWTRAMIEQLRDYAERSVEHGLTPEDFHVVQLQTILDADAGTPDAARRAEIEILCTDALVRLAITLKYGKLDPADLDPAWNFSRDLEREDPVGAFNEALDSQRIGRSLDELAPDADFYDRLRQALVDYRSLADQGGWPTVPTGPVLQPGQESERVPALRRRLIVSGDLPRTESTSSTLFDEPLEAAVKRFQLRHGIEVDGKVGPRTLEELNVPVEDRIDQIRASLERVRWAFRDIGDDFIVVDLAGFRLYLFQDGVNRWQTRVQVGKPFHATPVFKDTIRYLEFNPTWTIPPGILRNETLPAIRRDPDYLAKNNMSVLTMAGQRVDPASIDWPATAGGSFPYMIRQEPGPGNALGRVKFMFPNRYMVYLHDTPSKGLFSRSERAFSHGCIRTQNPFELAELLLADQGWDRARIDRVLASEKTTRVNLETPMPVMLLYWTAEVDEDGTIHFRKDFYERDRAIIEGLDEPFGVSPPKGAREAVSGR